MRKKNRHHGEMLLTHLGEALRNRRLDLLVSQEELASRVHCHRTYITDVESGYRNISLLTFEKLTLALQCALSFPIVESERTMAAETRSKIFDQVNNSTDGRALLPRDTGSFVQILKNIALHAAVKANMTKLQVAIEKYASEKDGAYPQNEQELLAALSEELPVNPFTKTAELPSFGTIRDELVALKSPPGILRSGSIEYSSVGNGVNYILRGGASDGTALVGRIPNTTYVLSGNLRNDNQP